MKTLIRIALAIAIMLITSIGYSNYEGTLSSNFFNNERPSIMVKKGQKMQIKNASGTIIYAETINYNGQLSNAFDLHSLKDGFYTLELSKAFEINIKKFAVENHKVTYFENGESTIFKPVFRMKDNRIYISQLSFDPVKWNIDLYFNDELIHSEDLEGNTILERIYLLDKDINGNYKVVLRSNDRLYEQLFKS